MNSRTAFLAALLAAASTSPSAAGPKNPSVFIHLDISDITSLDPAWANDAASHHIILHLYEPLLTYKPASLSKLEPLIASKVPSVENGLISPDRLTYRFPIRKNVRFHDGTPLTPEDVRFSILRFCLMDRDGGPSFNLLEPLLGLASTREGGKVRPDVFEKLDRAVRVENGEVVIRLQEPFAPFLSVLAVWAPVLSRAWSKEHGGWDGSAETWQSFNNPQLEDSPFHEKANGTGPFKLERWTKQNKEVHLVRHEYYWRKPSELARVVVRGVSEWTTRKLMLSAGDADSVYADRTVFPEAKALPGVEVIDDLPVLQSNPVVFFNYRIEPSANPDIGSGRLDGEGIPPDFFSDLDVRLGFAHALDAQAFIRDALRGKGERAAGCVPKGLLGNAEKGAPDYNPEKAREHMRKAWGGQAWEKGFRFTLTYNSGNAMRETLAMILKRGIEDLNPRFRVDIRAVQWSTYLSALDTRRLPLYVLGWSAAYPDPHDFAFPFLHSKGHFATRQGFSDKTLDELVASARGEPDPKRRRNLYLRAQDRARELSPQLYIAHGTAFRTQRTWVKGWTHRPIFPGAPWTAYLYGVRKE